MKNRFAFALLLAPAVAAGAIPSLSALPSVSREATLQTAASDVPPLLSVVETGMRGFTVTLRPNVRETRVAIGGKTYDSISLPGAVSPAAPGAPSVPFIARPFALPAGAKATARIVSLTTTRRLNRWLRPTPPNWEDEEGAPEAPVVEDPAYYGSPTPYPASLVTVRTGSALAGIPSGVLQLSAARFAAGARTLDIVREMTVEVTFDRAFAARPVVQGHADIAFGYNFVNANILDMDLSRNNIISSPELLIITDDLLKPAADRLAAWKEQKGIDTWVVTTAAVGTDAATLKSYIQSVYDALDSDLAYVLFLGDVDRVPTNYVAKDSDAPGAPPSMASDLPYAQLDGSGDVRPDVAYGRISVDALGGANTAVDKILDYEKTPSFDAATYDSLAFAGYFQDDVRAASLNINGVLVQSRALGGNDISVEIVNPPIGIPGQSAPGPYFPNAPLTVTVTGKAIRVALGSNGNGYRGSSWRDVSIGINGFAAASALVISSEDVDVDDDGNNDYVITDPALTRSAQFLTGGMVRDGVADKPYIDLMEEIRGVLLGHGKTIDRLYSTNTLPDVPAGPQTFNDSSPLPAELRVANGFLWDADAAGIQAAFNAGRAIVWHRDHGSRDGWFQPSFGISDVAALDNGDVDPADAYEDRLPVVFSINCSSGRFDDDPLESFAEKLLRESDGGAVAVVAASRNSSTSRNQVLSFGLFDAFWGDVLATHDPSMATTTLPANLRLGDVLNYAKDWVLTSYPDPADAYTIDQIEMYHLHGDPTLEVWTARPKGFLPTLTWLQATPGDVVVRVEVRSDVGQPHLALWDAVREVSAATLLTVTPTGDGRLTRVYELDYPDSATGDITLYLTQPGYRPYVAVVSPVKPGP